MSYRGITSQTAEEMVCSSSTFMVQVYHGGATAHGGACFWELASDSNRLGCVAVVWDALSEEREFQIVCLWRGGRSPASRASGFRSERNGEGGWGFH